MLRVQWWAPVLVALLAAACGQATTQTPVPTAQIPIIPTATAFGQTTGLPDDQPNWADLGLAGHLLVTLGNQGIQQVDLASGEVRVVFLPPENGWMTAADRSPDGRWLALAYAPPPADGEVQLGYTSIYLLPGECASRPAPCGADDLMLAVERTGEHAAYFSPLWSPDGSQLYFAHFTPSNSETSAAFKYTLERVRMEGGTVAGAPEVVLDDGLWPAISPDGSQLVYVYSDPDDFTNWLRLLDLTTGAQVNLVGPETFEAVDAPFFARDGSQVFFSAVGDGPVVSSAAPANRLPGWAEWLLGVDAAAAAGEDRPTEHNVPSDWWVMPAAGGAPTRLTQVYDTGLFGDISPTGEQIAYVSASGLFVMQSGGGELQRLLDLAGFGTLEWVE